MDVILELADTYVFDKCYLKLKNILPVVAASLKNAATTVGLESSHATNAALNQIKTTSNHHYPLSGTEAELASTLATHLERDALFRQFLSLSILVLVFAFLVYFLCGTVSYFFFFDRNLEKHPRFLKDQIRKEIRVSLAGFPLTTLLTVPWFIGEVRGYSQLYDDLSERSLTYTVFSAVWFLVFTDACIYWIHRALHHPKIYWYLHKPHHRWLVPTPFASHAFHPLDGYSQSVPYHLFVYLFPLNKYLYLALFGFVNIWTVGIHSGYFPTIPFINGPGHHTVHHMDFNYNFGQYLTYMDKLGGTYREPRNEVEVVHGRKEK